MQGGNGSYLSKTSPEGTMQQRHRDQLLVHCVLQRKLSCGFICFIFCVIINFRYGSFLFYQAACELSSLLNEILFFVVCVCVDFGRITAVESLFSPAPSVH